jgi:hypothetical protein
MGRTARQKKQRREHDRTGAEWGAWSIGVAPDDDHMGVPIWNNLYTVWGRVSTVQGLVIYGREVEQMVHLSIKRNDRGPVIDWRDKLRIKNELCGPESEAVELYPSMKRLVDGANQFHLWVIGFQAAPKTKEYSEDVMERQHGLLFPFGFTERLVMNQHESRGQGLDPTGKLKQRKLPDWMESQERLDTSIQQARRYLMTTKETAP